MMTEMAIALHDVDVDVILDMDHRGMSDAAQSELNDMIRVVNEMPRNIPITIWGADYEEMMTVIRRNGMWELSRVGRCNLSFRVPRSEMFNPETIVEWLLTDPAHHEDY